MAKAKTRSGDKDSSKSAISELVGLTIAYVKQETVDPIKALGKYVAFGVAGAVLITFGGVLLTLTAVRAAQAETGRHLTGSFTWVPYTAGLIVAAALTGLALRGIVKGRR